MAQAKGLVKLLKVKVGLVTSQKDELHGVLDKYVAKMTDEAKEAIEIEGHDVNRLREINSTIETVYEYLFHITSQMDDDTPTQIPSATGLSSTPPSSSSSLQKSSSGSRQKKSRDTETDEMSKLHHRIEALESGLTACRNEMVQTTTHMTQAKDQLDTRCLRLEEKVQHLTNQNQETEMKQDVKFESMDKKIGDCQRQSQAMNKKIGDCQRQGQAMDKKIGDCQRQSQENDRRLRANLENHSQKLDDVVKKVEEISAQVDRHETEEMTKLHRRAEVLESAFTACRNEISQTEKKQAVKFESMDKKIEDCQRQSKENDQRLANLESHTQKLDDVVKKVDDISTQLDKLERSLVPTRVGFTAYHTSRPVPSVGSRITGFTDVLCNEGNHYNPSTGEFICPIDGLYLVSATLWQWLDGVVDVNIKRQTDNTTTPPTVVCMVYTDEARPSSCGVGVVRLKTGDRVYVELVYKSGSPALDDYSSFSCLLIS